MAVRKPGPKSNENARGEGPRRRSKKQILPINHRFHPWFHFLVALFVKREFRLDFGRLVRLDGQIVFLAGQIPND